MFGNQQGYFEPIDASVNEVDEAIINAYVAKVFGWMFIGLLVTAITTVAIIYGINVSFAFTEFINTAMQMVLIVFIAQVVLVGFISARVQKMNPFTAKVLYLIYAMSNGLTVGLAATMFAVQAGGGLNLLGMAFGITAVSFGVMAAYGYFTGKDLTHFSSLLRMALFGLILAIVVNMFLGSSMMDLLICVVGLFLFLGLTAADTNKIKNHFARVAVGSGGRMNSDGTYAEENPEQAALASNLAIYGALILYLDFINIFMFILRLLGRRR